MSEPDASGYAPLDGVEMYWESYGSGCTPLILVHGGYGLIADSRPLIATLAQRRRVIGIELQGHGHTRDVERPLRYESLGDDIAGLIEHLGLERADLLGYSLGAGAVLQTAIKRPSRVRKLVIVSFPARRDGWFPEVRAAFDQMGSALFEQLRHSLMYRAWAEVAPEPDAFPALMDKLGDLQRTPYDWRDEARELTAQTMLVYADADSVSPAHVAEFWALLGGGLRDACWDGSARPRARLAILPGATHYDVFASPRLGQLVDEFLAEPVPSTGSRAA